MIPLLDLTRIHAPIQNELKNAATRVIDHGRYIMGEEVSNFEAKLQSYTSSNHIHGCASGSDALLLALMALDLDEGDEVITTPYTFFSTVSAIERLKLKTKFVDIDPISFNIDPEAVEKAITPKTKAVIAVHLFGQTADMKSLAALCQAQKLYLIEDAAQALGARWDGKMAGTIGDIGTYSFFPSKNLGGLGDGGAIASQAEEIASKINILRLHGASPKYYHKHIGINSRLDAMQAALLMVKLPHLDSYSEGRRNNAELYHKHLSCIEAEPGEDTRFLDDTFRKIGLPKEQDHAYHVYNQFVIRSARRDALREHLRSQDIGNEVYYPVPLHLQECFAYLGHKEGDFPHSEAAAKTSLALPVFGELSSEAIKTVADAIIQFHKHS